MSFRVERVYTVIPCQITYTVYEASGTIIFTETITNPPGPPPPAPPCFIGTPAYLTISVIPGTPIPFTVPVDCSVVSKWINCPTPHFHPFSACLITDPTSTCSNVLQINL